MTKKTYRVVFTQTKTNTTVAAKVTCKDEYDARWIITRRFRRVSPVDFVSVTEVTEKGEE